MSKAEIDVITGYRNIFSDEPLFPEDFETNEKDETDERMAELANFLGSAPVSYLDMESVIPIESSNKKLGIMYFLTIGRTDEKGIVRHAFRTSSSIVEKLTDTLLNSETEEGERYKEHRQILENLELINEETQDSFNWDIFLKNRRIH